VAAFSSLLDLLADVPDPRRAEGKLYKLPHVLLFSILAIVAGCNSYRGIVTFIDEHRRRLNAAFGLKWKRAPGKRKRSPTFRRGSELSILPVVVDEAVHDGRERELL